MIKESIENIARTKDKALVSSLGFDVSESEEETDQSSGEDDCDTDDQAKYLTLNNHNVEESTLLDILKESDFNWYRFVMILRDVMKDMGEETFNEVLNDFGKRISSLGLSQHEQMITEQSRQAYLITTEVSKREGAAAEEIIVSSVKQRVSSENSENELLARNGIPDSPTDERVAALLKKRRAALWRREVSKSKGKIAAQRFLRRRE